jgi:hypothetical protein
MATALAGMGPRVGIDLAFLPCLAGDKASSAANTREVNDFEGGDSMRVSNKLLVLTVLALPFVSACNAHRDSTASETSSGQTGDLNAVEAQAMVDDVTLGKTAEPDGTIPAADQKDDFAPGEPIVLTMKVADAPPGTDVKVVWYGPGETKVGEVVKPVGPSQDHLIFQAGDTTSWANGDYRAEVWVGDEKVAQQQLQIVESPA